MIASAYYSYPISYLTDIATSGAPPLSCFTVLTAVDGRAGLELFRQRADGIDAVLLDLTMPHMNGEEAFRALRRIRTDVPVILTSGYSEQDMSAEFAGKGIAGFLQKPFRFEKLQEQFRAVLQNRRQPSA